LLVGAAGGAALIAADAVGRADPAEATDGGPVVLCQTNTARNATIIQKDGGGLGAAVAGEQSAGGEPGVVGRSEGSGG
jgi:hypothetical protein